MGLWDVDKIEYVGRAKGPKEDFAFHYYDADGERLPATRPMNIDCKMYSFEKGYIEHRDRTPVQLLFGK